MEEVLKILFTTNIILLILHEMDAIFWKEWRIFGINNDKIGRSGFILAHIPIFIVILSGLLYSETTYGKLISIILSGFLVVHFGLHLQSYSKKLFNELLSFGIISALLVVSLLQGIFTIITILT